VQIAAGFDDGLIVSWDEQAGSLRRIALARGVADDGGAVRFTRETLNEQAPAVSPVMARTEDGLVIAWTSGKTGESRIRVERLR
jgi:hypothetical protein